MSALPSNYEIALRDAEDRYIYDLLAKNPDIQPSTQLFLRQLFRRQWVREHGKPPATKPANPLTPRQQSGMRKWQKARSLIWRDGRIYYWLPDLAMMRQVSYKAIRRFAARYPELVFREGRWIYCRDEEPGGKYPSVITVDGKDYHSMPHLAAKRGVTLAAAHAWAKLRPHLCMRHRDRLYARDEGWKPKTSPPVLTREGVDYFSAAFLADKRGLSENAVRQWAQRHPEHALKVGGAWYLRDEAWRPMRAEPFLWRDGKVYFSIAELARRRCLSQEPVRVWARRHPHLTIQFGRCLYCQDEEWASGDPAYIPPPLPDPPPATEVVPEAVKYRAARRRK